MPGKIVGGELLSTVNMMRRHIYNNRMEIDDPRNHPTSTQEWFLVYIVQRWTGRMCFRRIWSRSSISGVPQPQKF